VVADGDNLGMRANLADDTIANYLRAAATWLQDQCGVSLPLYTNRGGTKKTETLHPYLAAILSDRRTWKKARPKREPLTGAILDRMAEMAKTASDQSSTSSDAAMYDWSRLGLFTGSRLAEYGQSALPRGTPHDGWDVIPTNRNVPQEWRGKPKAFVASDFTFFDEHLVRLPDSAVLAKSSRVMFVHIRYRYDKSTHNFVTRKYRRVHGHHLCPVKSCISILDRAYHMRIAAFEPLGMFVGKNHKRYTIRGKHIQQFMQRACTLTYTNPQHFMRLHVKLLATHSIRITAAVALFNAGVSEDDISFRLRWNSDAVKFYLRECRRTIGDLTSKAIIGAYADIAPP
jgi:hypothetical protein